VTILKAILYTLRELGRRAGASPEWISGWRVRFGEKNLTLFPEPSSDARVIFPFDPLKARRFETLKESSPSRYEWMHFPGTAVSETVPNLIVLFEDEPREGVSLFQARGEQTVECQGDLLTCALWTLARMEELQPAPLDEHARFPATASAAFRAGCIERPIVDECALSFAQALSSVLPRWKPNAPAFRFKLSHDIDLVGFPRSLRSTVGHVYPRRIPQAFLRDVLSAAGAGIPAYLQSVLQTALISEKRGLHSSFYWQACTPSAWDTGYDLQHPQIRAVIKSLSDRGFELGIHPGYSTFNAPQRLQDEVNRLRAVVGDGPIGGRQHFLRWHPRTWRMWEDAHLAYDSTVGFADAMGFRAGTCVPYHPWLIEEDRESPLVELPLIVMDCTPVRYMRLTNHQALSRIAALVARCRSVGGVFALLWHNDSVITHPYAELYPQILDIVGKTAPYDYKSDLELLSVPSDIGEASAV